MGDPKVYPFFDSAALAGIDPLSLRGNMPRFFQCAGGCGKITDALGEEGEWPKYMRVAEDFSIHYYCQTCEPPVDELADV